MSTRQTQIATTITVDGIEQDVEARADVAIEPADAHYSGAYAQIDGDVEVLVGGAWLDMDDLSISVDDRVRIGDALRERALEDRRDAQQLRADHYAERSGR